MVAGIPLGRIIGETLGWRMTFQVIAAAAVAVFLMLRATLPELPSQQAGSLRSLPVLLKQPTLMGLYLVTLLVISAHFTAYTYIEPLIQHVNDAGGSRITFILTLFGAAGIPAAIGFNKFYAQQPERFMRGCVMSIAACLLVLFPCSLHIATLSIHAFVWGGSIICFGLAMQAWVLRLAPAATDLAVSIFSGLYNVAIGAGALFGNHIANSFGISWLGTFGGIIAVLGTGVCWLALRARHPRAGVPVQ
jgi:DHA1 family L-arabinose/isopropyl-beta-D-thiogalactopyranoside export protein-like MFS transporter